MPIGLNMAIGPTWGLQSRKKTKTRRKRKGGQIRRNTTSQRKFNHFKFMYHYSGTFEEYIHQFAEGGVDYGNYFDHLASWWPHRNDKNVLFLRYEEMRVDLQKTVEKIS